MKHEVIILPAAATFAWRERCLLAGLLAGVMALMVSTFFAMRPFPMERIAAGPPRPATQTLDIAALGLRLDTTASDLPDLAATAELPPPDVFAPAKGPPLNLLAQVVEPAVQLAAADPVQPVLAGPVLTEEERRIVDANAERREVRLALEQLFERSESGTVGVAAAVLVQPLLRRAERAAIQLDVYGDALLLSEGPAMKEAAFAGFHASRAAALMDMERAEAILG